MLSARNVDTHCQYMYVVGYYVLHSYVTDQLHVHYRQIDCLLVCGSFFQSFLNPRSNRTFCSISCSRLGAVARHVKQVCPAIQILTTQAVGIVVRPPWIIDTSTVQLQLPKKCCFVSSTRIIERPRGDIQGYLSPWWDYKRNPTQVARSQSRDDYSLFTVEPVRFQINPYLKRKGA